MQYAKVENNQVVQVGLPTVGTLKDGNTVSGYDLLDPLTLFEEGWRPLEDTQPENNEETERIEFISYVILEDKVVATYEVKAIEIVQQPPSPPSQEERLQALELATLVLMEVLSSV